MVMVAHEREPVEADAKVLHTLGEMVQNALSIPLIAEQPIPGLPPGAQQFFP